MNKKKILLDHMVKYNKKNLFIYSLNISKFIMCMFLDIKGWIVEYLANVDFEGRGKCRVVFANDIYIWYDLKFNKIQISSQI